MFEMIWNFMKRAEIIRPWVIWYEMKWGDMELSENDLKLSAKLCYEMIWIDLKLSDMIWMLEIIWTNLKMIWNYLNDSICKELKRSGVIQKWCEESANDSAWHYVIRNPEMRLICCDIIWHDLRWFEMIRHPLKLQARFTMGGCAPRNQPSSSWGWNYALCLQWNGCVHNGRVFTGMLRQGSDLLVS